MPVPVRHPCEALSAGRFHGPGDPEIGHDGLVARQQDVGRLDVPVDDPFLVRVGEGRGDLVGEPECLVHGDLALPVQPVLERLSLHVRHDIVEEASRLSRIVQGQDVGMAQVGRDLDLPHEPIGPESRGQFGVD
jgi:hypothetical protein